MSSIGMMGANILESLLASASQHGSQKFKQNFQQLGQDIQSGNVSQAKSDLATLGPLVPSNSSSSTPSSPVSQAINQLSQDLQSGNLTAAQSDYAALQNDLQQSAGHVPHHHAHHSASSEAFAEGQQALSQLGQALQSGNLGAAQQAYTALQADATAFASFGSSDSSSASSPAGTNVNFTA